MGRPCLGRENLAKLTEVSRFVYETANMLLVPGQPYVGPSAFAHKGGMHVAAIAQRPPHLRARRPEGRRATRGGSW